jgi:hypothetical protein
MRLSASLSRHYVGMSTVLAAAAVLSMAGWCFGKRDTYKLMMTGVFVTVAARHLLWARKSRKRSLV